MLQYGEARHHKLEGQLVNAYLWSFQIAICTNNGASSDVPRNFFLTDHLVYHA